MARRPNTIAQRIALEGGDEIRKELKALGLAGEVAFRELKKSADALNKTGLGGFTASLQKAQKDLERVGKQLEKTGAKLRRTGRTLSLALTAPIVGGFTLAVKAATDFESKMADIARVVDIPTPGGLTQLGGALRAMAIDLGVTLGDLQDIATAAGQAGIPFAELADFTELVATAAIALNLSFEETGRSLAKIQAALGLTTAEVGSMVDAIAVLADTNSATDAEIIQVVQRIGALGKQANLSELDIAALGASLIGMGVDSESAGTAIRNMLLNLSAGEAATDGFREALGQLGLDAVDVANRLQTEGIGVIIDIFERLRQQAPAVRLALIQGLFDKRAAQSLAPLVTGLAVLEGNLETVGDEANFAGRALQEFARRAQTPAQRFRVFQAVLNELAITIGSELMPVVLELTEALTGFLKGLSESEKTTIRWGVAIAAAVAAVGPFVFGLGVMLQSIGKLLLAGSALLKMFAAIRAAFLVGGLTAAAVATPFTALLVVMTAVVGGIALLATRHSEAGRAARTHADAVAHLDSLIAQSKSGVEGATEAARKYADEQIRATRAVVEAMRAEIERFNIINEFGQEQEQVTGGPDITTVRDATQRIADFEQRLDELAESGKDAFGTVARGAREAGKAIGDAGRELSKFPGPEAHIRSVSDPFNAARDAAEKLKEESKKSGDEAERSGKRTEDALGGIQAKVVTVDKAWLAARDAAVQAGRDTSSATDAAATSAGHLVEEAAKVAPALTEAGTAASGALEPVGAAVEATRASIQAAKGDLEAFAFAATEVPQSFTGIETQAAQTAQSLPGLFTTAAEAIADAFSAAFARIRSDLAGLTSAVTAAIARMTAELARLRAAIASAKAAASSGGGGGGGGFSKGGQVFGAGTGTSDSIMARLSHGEFVIRAAAVEHFGPAFFAALNSLRVPLDDLLRGFNVGGIVDGFDRSMRSLSPVQSFAKGGLALAGVAPTSGSSGPATRIDLHLGGRNFPVLADDDVARALVRVVRREQSSRA
jgi:TP901 family phage tail tape measure protein